MKNWQRLIVITLGVVSMICAFLSGASKSHQHLFAGLMIGSMILGFWLLLHFLDESDRKKSVQSQQSVSMIYMCPFCHKDIVKEPYIKIDNFVRAHRDCIEEEVKNSRILELSGIE